MKKSLLLGMSLSAIVCLNNAALAQHTITSEHDFESNVSLLTRNQIARPNFHRKDPGRIVSKHPAAMHGSANKVLKLSIEDKTCSDTYKLSPTWMSKPEVVYVPCPEIKVGIGTEAPQEKLDVRGTAIISTGLKLGQNTTYAQSAFIDGLKTANCARPLIRFMTQDGGTDKTLFLVKNDGGIYCTSARIRVKDDIPVPDFVFQPDYKLMPLREVKSFVDKHQHLPGIPSEKEIREEGLSLEEMQLKLLQKVEELTLYMIELEQKNDELTKEIKQLKWKQEE